MAFFEKIQTRHSQSPYLLLLSPVQAPIHALIVKMSNQDVNCYNESSRTIQSVIGSQLLDKLPVAMQQGWKVADLGCGTGLLALKMADVVGETGLVVAVDRNSKRIDYFKQSPQTATKKNLIILNQGAENCNFQEFGKFNLMFSNVAMHWIPEDKLKLIYQSAFEALDKGGFLAVAVAEMSQEEGGYRRMFHTCLPDDVKNELFRHVFSRPLDWYVNLVQGAGFTILEQGYLNVSASYPSEQDLFIKLNATFEDMFSFEKYFNRQSLEHFGLYTFQPDGSITVDGRASFFIARKG